MSPDLLLMLLADARLPVAGHTQSGTVEAALADGLDAADVPRYVRMRLATVARVEAGAAVVARHLVVLAEDGQLPLDNALSATDDAWAARTPSAPVREAARGQGRALLRLADRLWPDGRGVAAVRGLERPSRSVVLGALAADLGLDAAPLARLVGYDDVQTVCAASLKLAPLDPVGVTGWVRDALPLVDALADAVADLTRPDALPALSSPRIEAWAQAHALTTRRLFRA